MEKKENFKTYDDYDNQISKYTDNDFIDMIVEKYNTEIKFGIKIIDEFYLMSKYCHGLNSLFIRTETEMQFKQDEKDLVNSFVEKVRRKNYSKIKNLWKKLTNDLTYKYMDKINTLKDYDFFRL